MADLKGVSEIIGKFKNGQRLFVLILILFFTSGTYITTSYLNTKDSTKQEERIKQLENNIQSLQITQDGLISQNNKLILFITELNNMLIEKRNNDIKYSKEVLVEQPRILKSIRTNDTTNIVSSTSYVETPPIIKKVIVNDTKFYDNIINKINTQLVENKKVKK